MNDFHLDTDSLPLSNLNPPPRWKQRTYLLSPGPFRYRSIGRELTPEVVVHRGSLSAGARMVAQLDDNALHVGIYSLRGGRFMHVEGPWDDLGSITLGGGLREAIVHTESEGLMLLFQGELARRLLQVAQKSAGPAIARQNGAAESFTLVPSAGTRHLATLIGSALDNDDPRHAETLAVDLARVFESLLPTLTPLLAELPPPRSQRRKMALQFEQRVWEALPVRGSFPDVNIRLCEELGFTRRSLQLAVREHFGMSCQALQQVIRLNHAHLLLQDEQSARNVTDAALAAGFTHMGRFSQQYRALFGETPSATLAAAS